MAVIARRAFLLVSAAALTLRADDNLTAIRQLIADVAQSLSSGEPAQAIEPFSKSCPDYDRLSHYFQALTDGFEIHNELDFTDEDITAPTATITVHWTMTLDTTARSADLTIKLVQEKKHWRITSLSPVTLFDPALPAS